MKPKRVIAGLIMMLFVPLIVFFVTLMNTNFGAISTYSASMLMSFALLPMLYWWMLGLVFTILVSGATSGVIADEVDKGTMLLLVSKPVSRVQIFLGKFLGVFAFGALMSFVGIFLGAWVAVMFTSGNIAHFFGMLPFLLFMFAYGLFVELIFLSISIALSSMMATGRKVLMACLGLVVLTFLVFFMIRRIAPGYYETYSLYWFDIGYHLGNILANAIQVWNILPASTLWQTSFDIYTSAFAGATTATIDTSQGIDLGGLPLAGYVAPVVSLLIWLLIAILLTLFGLYKLKRKEITN